MASSITKKYAINAKGILHIDGEYIGIENTDTGEMFSLPELAADFADKTVKFSITYDEDYGYDE